MALIRYVPLYFMAMPQSIIIIIKAPFVSTMVTTVDNIKSRQHTPRGTKFVNLHEDFRGKVNKDFACQPLDQGGGCSNSPRPSAYFGLLMVHPSRPPLPPSRPYCSPLNYLEYVDDSNLDAHVKVFKASIRTIVKQMT